jgi:hypothetical protein
MNRALQSLFRCYSTVLAKYPQGRVFDSHEFIQRLSQANQRRYIRALRFFMVYPDPFRKLHFELSGELLNHTASVRYVGRHRSANIFGDIVSCATWVKL